MSKKLPLEIRRNYTIIDRGPSWELICIVCSSRWNLNKPEKGKQVHGGNVLHLLEHAASHPLPKEDTEVTSSLTQLAIAVIHEPVGKTNGAHVELQEQVGETEERIVELVEDPPTPPKHSYPSERTPNAYKVEMNGNKIEVSRFKDPMYTKYRQVQKNAYNVYSVVLYAANSKHAELVGVRLIEAYINANRD